MIQKFYISDMTCAQCEINIKKQLERLEKVDVKEISHSKGYVVVQYEEGVLSQDIIESIIINSGYTVERDRHKSTVVLNLIAFAMFVLVIQYTVGFDYIPEINANYSYGVLFIVGMLTSVHCVSMCGGIAFSQSISTDASSNMRRAVSYNLGRLTSYTLLGGVVGLAGRVLIPSNTFKSIFLVGIGLFMFALGMKMMGIVQFPKLFTKKIRITFPSRLHKYKKFQSLIVGLLNGFMPCGPLQTMQFYALSTLSFSKGAISMFFFALGTIPLMFLVGSVGHLFTKKQSKQLVRLSGALIMIMSLSIINRGLVWSGTSLDLITEPTVAATYSEVVDGYQIVQMDVNGYYDLENVTVKKGIPVKLQIDAQYLTPCIDTITIPELDVVKGLAMGENEIVFTPENEGDLVITCWMAMVTTTLDVE